MHKYEIIAKELGITINKLATSTGIPASTIKMGVKRGSPIDRDIAHKIKLKYPQFNEDWIVTGIEPMLFKKHVVDEPDQPYNKGKNKKTSIADIVDKASKEIVTAVLGPQNINNVTYEHTEIINNIQHEVDKLKKLLKKRKEDNNK